eukprot:945359-Pyramimonas_sp.AAC.1
MCPACPSPERLAAFLSRSASAFRCRAAARFARARRRALLVTGVGTPRSGCRGCRSPHLAPPLPP